MSRTTQGACTYVKYVRRRTYCNCQPLRFDFDLFSNCRSLYISCCAASCVLPAVRARAVSPRTKFTIAVCANDRPLEFQNSNSYYYYYCSVELHYNYNFANYVSPSGLLFFTPLPTLTMFSLKVLLCYVILCYVSLSLMLFHLVMLFEIE